MLKSGKHTVTAISRADSKSKLPEGVHVVKVDYSDHKALVDALRGQDALVITMGVSAPSDQEVKLVEAAAAAGVPFILPNEWGLDSANVSLTQDIMFHEQKQAVKRRVEELGKSSWISVVTGFWYEWSLGFKDAYGFDFANRTLTLFDEGETKINTVTWPQVGRIVASLLSLERARLEQFKNKYVYATSFTVSQRDMFDSVMRVTGTTAKDWTVTKQPARERFEEGRKAVSGGDQMGFIKLLYTRPFLGDDGNFGKTKGLQNDMLALPKEDIDDFTKIGIERQKSGGW